MEVIQQRLRVLITSVIMVLLVTLILFIKGFFIFMIDMRVVFAILLFASIILVSLLILEYERFNAAKLIIENIIMNIQVAKIDENSTDVLEFIISCFGILLGSKVIKFNIDGIRLEGVEITHDTICIVYRKDNKRKSIQLLHGTIGKQEIKGIAERFQYETGIIPNVID